ncbi:anaphase promoting complex subunit 4 [Clonorchis sinensis]|uniref:Anaphase-promoting complex subunit 4 n=1 Tax=Clonorchis sinensis TaxID=79923 RepID=A0A8T1MS22_CLOSI|nr:anaphase promoting complex subunit 4 [Clonorchis sinensis]
MVGEYSYCPVEAKHYLKNKVSHCCWSPRTDLIALGSLNGRVSVHRYKLACIWESLPPHQNSVVTCVVWRPDGKCLAVAYDSGHVRLILANDGFVYKEFQYPRSITFLNWTAGLLTKQEGKGSNAPIYFPDLSSLTMFQSDVNFNTSDTFKLSQLLADSEEHFFILTVYCAGVLNFYGSDSFLIARWACKPNLLSTELQFKFLGCQFSACLKYLLILYSWTEETTGRSFMELQWVPTTGLVTFGTQLRNLSMHHSLIRISKTLLDKGFDQICTSWEDMILEMDVKFTNYAKERLSRNKKWSLGVELLEFILFGNCPTSLRKFLVEDWTAPSLKRTGTATLKAYESIKTICFQQLQLILQRLLFHTSELLGNLRDTQSYAKFGVSVKQASRLCGTIGCVLQKSQELHLVIEKSITHLRAFFKWLYVAILGLSGRVLPDDFPRVTPAERELVIDFITNYLQPVFVQGSLQSFSVDLVEQYIRPGEVRKPLEAVSAHSLNEDRSRSHMRTLIHLSEEQLKSGRFPTGLFHYCPKATLADLIMHTLEDDITTLFGPPAAGDFDRACFGFAESVSQLLFCEQLQKSCVFDPAWDFCSQFPAVFTGDSRLRNSPTDSNRQSTYLAWSPSRTELLLTEFPFDLTKTNLHGGRTACLEVDDIPMVPNPNQLAYEIQDLEFFTPELLTLLLRQTTRTSNSETTEEPSSTSHIVMVPVQLLLAACDEGSSSTPVSTACEPLWSSSNCHLPAKRLSELITSAHVESLPCTATKLATNGGRSILFVLFEGSCMCRVYLLDCPETDGSVVRDDGEDGVGDAVMEAGDSDVVENVT